MKGESGVVGMNDIGTFCHAAEECLDGSGGDISVDLLLEIKDWLEKAITAYANREKPGAPPDILVKRKQAAAENTLNAERGTLNVESVAAGKTLTVESGTLNVGTPTTGAVDGADDSGRQSPAVANVPIAPAAQSGPVHMPSSVPISDRDLAKDFVGESQEHFDAADENLLILEDDPANTDAVGAVFRAFHTIKGVSVFLGLKPVGDLAHVAETLLDEVRKGKRQFTGNVVDVTFAGLDMLKTMMGDLKDALSAGTDMKVRPELPKLIGALKDVLAGVEQPLNVERGKSTAEKDVESGTLKVERETPKAGAAGSGEVAGNEHPTSNEEKTPSASSIAGNEHPTSNIQRPTSNEERAQATEPLKVETSVAGAADSSAAAGNAAEKTAAPREGVEVGQTMKVDAEKIDLLLDTIGELVIAESIVASDPDIQKLKSLRLEKNLSLLGKITRSLQDMGMAMRLVPIDATFRKMARLVRDLSKKSGKHVELAIEGGETEIDKSMVEKLGDPLVHMIRNSMDHGVESNEERKAKGKDPIGHVTLRAHHKGGSIHIDIEDDGKGLDREAIVAKAIEKGILKTGDGVPDQEVFALIFAAGFSTAKQITEISGRGVGMDVVRRNIESLRGNVLISTRPGQGTIFTIVLPLTMAIIDGMLARVSSEIYVLPTLSIIESLRPSPDMISTVTGKGEMVAFRGNLLPLFRLSDIFHVSGAITNPSDAIVMVVEEAGKRWGLLVDEILGQQQIVIKSLGDAMGIVPGVSGASIMADGRPGLILDIAGVIKLATE